MNNHQTLFGYIILRLISSTELFDFTLWLLTASCNLLLVRFVHHHIKQSFTPFCRDKSQI